MSRDCVREKRMKVDCTTIKIDKHRTTAVEDYSRIWIWIFQNHFVPLFRNFIEEAEERRREERINVEVELNLIVEKKTSMSTRDAAESNSIQFPISMQKMDLLFGSSMAEGKIENQFRRWREKQKKVTKERQKDDLNGSKKVIRRDKKRKGQERENSNSNPNRNYLFLISSRWSTLDFNGKGRDGEQLISRSAKAVFRGRFRVCHDLSLSLLRLSSKTGRMKFK